MHEMTLEVKEGHIDVDRAGLVYVTGIGAEVPFETKGDERRYHRDAEENPGIIAVIRGLHNIPSFLGGGRIQLDQRLIMNARSAGRLIALLHDLFERIGQTEAMHRGLDETRREIREKFDGVDFTEHVKEPTE